MLQGGTHDSSNVAKSLAPMPADCGRDTNSRPVQGLCLQAGVALCQAETARMHMINGLPAIDQLPDKKHSGCKLPAAALKALVLPEDYRLSL